MSDTLVGTFTVSVQSDRILLSSHGLSDGDQVRFAYGAPENALPTPLLEGEYYWVVGARGNDFQIESHPGNGAMIIEDHGVGSNEVWKKDDSEEPELNTRQMSSTVSHDIADYHFAVIKLVN